MHIHVYTGMSIKAYVYERVYVNTYSNVFIFPMNGSFVYICMYAFPYT